MIAYIVVYIAAFDSLAHGNMFTVRDLGSFWAHLPVVSRTSDFLQVKRDIPMSRRGARIATLISHRDMNPCDGSLINLSSDTF